MGAEADPLVFHRPFHRGGSGAPCPAVSVVLGAAVLLVVLAARPATAPPPAAAAALVDRDSAAYGAKYGVLAGDDAVQAAWPGLTCARSDDDKWDWADARATADNSGTNCVFGDSWFCEKQYFKTDDGEMTVISDLLWHYCNSTCNATDEARVARDGSDAALEGTSSLALCAFEGVRNMREVCAVANSTRFRPYTRRLQQSHDVAPSVDDVNDTVVYINGTWGQKACNTHALCSTCLVNASTGELDPYCEAFVSYYAYTDRATRHDPESASDSPGYSAQLFWYNVHFWCRADVLGAIEDGTFVAQVRDGAIRSASEVRVAVNNSEELKWWGTTSVQSAAADDGDDARQGGR